MKRSGESRAETVASLERGHGVAAINCSAHSLETDAAEMIESRLPILRRAGAEIGHSMRRFPQLSYSVRP